MKRQIGLLISVSVIVMAATPAFALTAADCAKLMDPGKKDECVRSLTAGKSGTTRATPADHSGSGPATPASPAVPGKGKKG